MNQRAVHRNVRDLQRIDYPFWIDRAWEIDISSGDDMSGNVRAAVEYDEQLGRFVLVDVTVSRAGPGTEVTGAMLRELRVQERVQVSAQIHVYVEREAVPYLPRELEITAYDTELVLAVDVLRSMPPVTGRAKPEHIARAELLYRIAFIVNLPPLKLVSDVLKVSQSTATRLVARARDAAPAPDIAARPLDLNSKVTTVTSEEVPVPRGKIVRSPTGAAAPARKSTISKASTRGDDR